MRVLFIPVTLDGAPGTAASLRFRAEWPAKYWPEADVYPNISRPIADYDAYVFQKAYLTDTPRRLIRELRRRGKLMAFDLCDADWLLSYEHERRLLNALPLFDFAVAPTETIARWLRTWLPAYVIPDRLDLVEFPMWHVQRPGKPTLVWFGYSHNIGPLSEMRGVICEHKLALTLVTDQFPDEWRRFGARFVKWTRHGANEEIARHDIALVPPVSMFKSNNRWITAWALGLVTAETSQRVEKLLDYETRRMAAQELRERVEAEYDVRLSVEDWQSLFSQFEALGGKREDLVRAPQ